MHTIKLICMSYAGGASSNFSNWGKDLAPHIKLIAVEYPGRGRRFSEPFCQSILEAVDDIYNQIKHELDETPFALFGHSMGSVLAFELAYKLLAKGHQLPRHLFFSGSDAPHLRGDDKKLHILPDEEFLQEINDLEGTPQAFFEQKELLDIFMPILRNDFKMIEEYSFEEKPMKLKSDFSVFYGTEEELKGDINGWAVHTEKECQIHAFEGGHFFINDKREEVLQRINDVLTKDSIVNYR